MKASDFKVGERYIYNGPLPINGEVTVLEATDLLRKGIPEYSDLVPVHSKTYPACECSWVHPSRLTKIPDSPETTLHDYSLRMPDWLKEQYHKDSLTQQTVRRCANEGYSFDAAVLKLVEVISKDRADLMNHYMADSDAMEAMRENSKKAIVALMELVKYRKRKEGGRVPCHDAKSRFTKIITRMKKEEIKKQVEAALRDAVKEVSGKEIKSLKETIGAGRVDSLDLVEVGLAMEDGLSIDLSPTEEYIDSPSTTVEKAIDVIASYVGWVQEGKQDLWTYQEETMQEYTIEERRIAHLSAIDHWRRFRDGLYLEGERPYSTDCALCGLYSNQKCAGCPVAAYVGRTGCVWEDYERAIDAIRCEGIDSKEFRKAAGVVASELEKMYLMEFGVEAR